MFRFSTMQEVSERAPRRLFAFVAATAAAVLALVSLATLPPAAEAVLAQTTKIHFIAFGSYANTDAIVIENNGKFGIVDSGEDADYPDGSDELYPLRSGISRAERGHEAEVIAYLESIGVTAQNLEFYIGTHAHSDHIGSADEIIRMFHPQRVYLGVYSDEFISDESRLWDNLYVYNNAVEAVEETGAVLIQHFDTDAGLLPVEGSTTANPAFALGDALIEIVNYEEDYVTEPKYDANEFSFGVKVTACGHTAFLAGDIGNREGDEDALAEQLGHVDVLKLGHHGLSTSNTEQYLNTLHPEYAIQTGFFYSLHKPTYELLNSMGTKVYSSDLTYQGGYPAIVAVLAEDGVTVEGVQPSGWVRSNNHWFCLDESTGMLKRGWFKDKGSWYYSDLDSAAMKTGWFDDDGTWYYLKSSGAMATGWLKVGDTWYLFNSSGAMQTGWVKSDGKWYYLDPETGAMQTGWLDDGGTWYCLKSSGDMATGWLKSGGKWYYLKSSGAMATGWLKSGGKWYFLKTSGVMATSEWCEGYWLGADGAWSYEPRGSWKKDSKGWWFGDTSGWYAKGSTVRIDDVPYKFDSRGYWLEQETA